MAKERVVPSFWREYSSGIDTPILVATSSAQVPTVVESGIVIWVESRKKSKGKRRIARRKEGRKRGRNVDTVSTVSSGSLIL